MVPTLRPPRESKFFQLALSEKSSQLICLANWTLSFLSDSSKLGLSTRGVAVASSTPAGPVPIGISVVTLFCCSVGATSRLTRRDRIAWVTSELSTISGDSINPCWTTVDWKKSPLLASIESLDSFTPSISEFLWIELSADCDFSISAADTVLSVFWPCS